MATAARRAVDKAVKHLAAAVEALEKLDALMPAGGRESHQKWIRDMGEYADYLGAVTWPDTMGKDS